MLGFGTVGVGHVWHLTLKSEQYVDELISHGDFEISGREVSVSRLQSMFLSATVFWLPFWVPEEHVTDSLEKLLEERVDITSEGKSYRAFLFVPGIPTVCFNCGRVGHMKNTCPGQQDSRLAVKRPSSSPVQIP